MYRSRFPGINYSLLLALICTATFVAMPNVLHAQPKPISVPTPGTRIEDALPNKDDNQAFIRDIGSASLPVERSIDPTAYFIGPTDQLLISVPALGLDYPTIVMMDNSVLLPRGLGTIQAKGKTLADVQSAADSLFRIRNGAFKGVTVSLLKPRSIYITVSGNVLAPDRYVLTSTDRVTTAIDVANRIPQDIVLPDKELTQLSKEIIQINKSQYGARNLGGLSQGKTPLRYAIVRHNDGTSDRADLIRYQAFGNELDNPTLREGDQVIVEDSDPSGATVAVAGAVNAPMGTIPYRAGDNALLLARLSAGFREDADMNAAYISRQTEAGAAKIPVDVNNPAALEGIPLQPGDQLVVPVVQRKITGRTGVVSVIGEVQRASAYPIVPGRTMLSDIIEQAGGFTSYASLHGAYIRRPADPLLLKPKQQLVDPISGMATSSLTLEDTTRFKFDVQLQQNMVSADFVGLFQNGDKSKDISLQNGDEIIIPHDPGAVYVSGRVVRPGWVTYRQGANFEYYIASAGGYTEAAEAGRVTVEKFGTGVWNDACCTQIHPGDKIYIPGERDTPARTSLEIAGTIVGITSGVLLIANTIINLIDTLSK